MTAMPRNVWAATLAKLVSPMDSASAAKAISSIVPMLNFPDSLFTLASAREVAATGRVFDAEDRKPDGTLIRAEKNGPLTRVPTFGEIEHVLNRIYAHEREMAKIRAMPVAREALPAPANYVPPVVPQTHPGQSPEACEHVASIVRAFVAERSFNQPANSPERAPVQPRHLSDGQLLLEYEKLAKQGVAGAHIRARMLREKIAKAEAAEAHARREFAMNSEAVDAD